MRRHRSSSQWESRALFQRMTTPPTETRKKLIDKTIEELKSFGIWYQLDVLYFFAAETQQAALLNWIKNSHDATAVNSPTFTANQGFVSDGSTSYLDLNYNPSAGPKYTLNSAMYGFYINTTAGSSNTIGEMGSRGASSTTTVNIQLAHTTSNKQTSQINSGTALSSTVGGDVTTALGFTIIQRTASNAYESIRNGVSNYSTTTASSGIFNGNFFACAVNDNGTPSFHSTRRLSIAVAGASLSVSQHYHFNRIVEAYMDAVGAGVQN